MKVTELFHSNGWSLFDASWSSIHQIRILCRTFISTWRLDSVELVLAEFLGAELVPSCERIMKRFRSLFMPNELLVGSSSIGIATPTSISNDPIDLPDAAAPMQQETMKTGDFGHCPIDVHTEMADTFLFSNICFPSMHQHFHTCNMFFDTICDLFEQMSFKRREPVTSTPYDKLGIASFTKISDTSTGSSQELSISGIQDVFHAREGYAINTKKSV